MGEVRIISAVESAKVKGGKELPKPHALMVVQWIGFIWMCVILLKLILHAFSLLAAAFGSGLESIGEIFVDSVILGIALTMFIAPFLGMFFCMKGSKWFVSIFCTCGAIMACNCNSIPEIVLPLGFVPPIAIWVFPSIRKWYDSLA